MTDPTLDTLTQRLDRLEREVRWWRLGVTAGTLLLVAVTVMGQTSVRRNDVEANRFVLRDSAGKTRAIWFTAPNGQPVFSLRGQGTDSPVMMTVGVDGAPVFALQDKGDKVRVVLTVENGSPRVSLHDSTGKPRALLNVASDGSPRLGLAGADGKPRIILGSVGEEHDLVFFDANGMSRTGVGLDPGGSPRLNLLDKDGKVIWKAP